MTRIKALAAAAAAIVVFGLQPAEAAGRRADATTLGVVSTGVGAGTTAGYFALNDWHWKWDSARHGITQTGAIAFTTIGCLALAPIVGTVVLQRALTYREAHVMLASCVVPIIGGWLVEQAYEHHVLWAPDEPQPVVVKTSTRRTRR